MIRLTRDLVQVGPQWNPGERAELKRVLEEERDALVVFEKSERGRNMPQAHVLDGIDVNRRELEELLSVLSLAPASMLETNRAKYRDFLVL